ncbi:MAG TPA: N-acetylglucosamine-6-phosphate deacetylase [Streptosporangiaceae bacterium]|nr:N-acetylglucosamine-6-phosphate deacetylase [Streptosporangiaceae bacterium]
MASDSWRIHGNLVRPDGEIRRGTVTVAGGQIISLDDEDTPRPDPASPVLVTPPGSFVGPGLIDLHMHGANGADFMAAEAGGAREITAFAARHGVTGMLASAVTATGEAISAALRTIAGEISEQAQADRSGRPLPGARLLGAHLEGPYLSQERRGGQDPATIRPASIAEFAQWAALAPLRMITVAPEAEGVSELIAFITATHPEVVVAAGHTNASYEQARRGIDAGIRHFTHFMCGMSGFHHREPGAVGAGLIDSPATVELIADLVHVHPAALLMVATARGPGHVALVTDSVNFCGLPDGSYTKRGRPYRVAGGSVRMADGTLAGSLLTMNRAVRNMAGAAVGVAAAWRMASAVPAAILGLAGRTGALAPGLDADIAVLDAQLGPQATVIRGHVVYDGAGVTVPAVPEVA